MSVIIKGIKKPSNCIWTEKCVGYKCPLLNDENCCNLQDCKEEWTWADQYAGCPLIELPDHHGDLVDVNEIRWDDHYDSDGNLSKYKMAYSDEMPDAIVEAE